MSWESEQAIDDSLAQEEYRRELPWWDPDRYDDYDDEDNAQ